MTDSTAGDFAHDGRQFGISGRFNVPRSPQGHPVIFQAGDSPTGREFAAADADCIFTRHGTIEAGQRFYQDVKGRLARYGRDAEELKVLPAATFVLGDTEAEALERCAVIRRQQVSGPTAILFLEQVWNRDLSGYDPDGPLPDSRAGPRQPGYRARPCERLRGPDRDGRQVAGAGRGQVPVHPGADDRGDRASVVRGHPQQVAGQIEKAVALRAADGFILVPHVTPGGLDEFADTVVPVLQERDRFRTDYDDPTLRDHLSLAAARSPRRPALVDATRS